MIVLILKKELIWNKKFSIPLNKDSIQIINIQSIQMLNYER